MPSPSGFTTDTALIPGPQGPLEAEKIAIAGATHAVVIVPGSGPTDRESNSAHTGLCTDTYKLLAEGLAQHGIASLRLDKRGMYGSAAAIADPNDVTIADYAEDARHWVDHATSLAPCIWLMGHSEGGLVALTAARSAPENLFGLILLATPGRPAGQVMLEQIKANPANVPLLLKLEAIIRDLEAGISHDPASLSQDLQPLFSAPLQRYMIDLFSHDPVTVAEGWERPVLIVQGDADIQISAIDADLLEGALPRAQRLALAGGTHTLKEAVSGDPLATYTTPGLPLHEDLVAGIVTFISANERPVPS